MRYALRRGLADNILGLARNRRCKHSCLRRLDCLISEHWRARECQRRCSGLFPLASGACD